jgi:hypothetical protein
MSRTERASVISRDAHIAVISRIARTAVISCDAHASVISRDAILQSSHVTHILHSSHVPNILQSSHVPHILVISCDAHTSVAPSPQYFIELCFLPSRPSITIPTRFINAFLRLFRYIKELSDWLRRGDSGADVVKWANPANSSGLSFATLRECNPDNPKSHFPYVCPSSTLAKLSPGLVTELEIWKFVLL